jgi:transcriptional regulator with XRE-family HTH domain
MEIHEAIAFVCSGWNQDELAEAMELDQSAISRWVRGKGRPSFEKLARLEDTTGHPRGSVLRLAGLINDEVNARQALALDRSLTAETRPILLAAYEAATRHATREIPPTST